MRDSARNCAYVAVQRAVRSGLLPRPDSVPCVDCNGPAKEYDHYLGYTKEHRLSVQAVCLACHGKRNSSRGEVPSGERHGLRKHPEAAGLAKLDLTTVEYIRGLRKLGFSCTELGKMYNVTKSTVSKVVLERTWK